MEARRKGERRTPRADLGDLATSTGDYPEAQADYPEAQGLITQALGFARELGEKDNFLIEVAAAFLAATGRPEHAGELLAAADEVNTRVGKTRSAWDQARYDKTVATCSGRLSPDAPDEAKRRGRDLDWASAVDRALSLLAQK